MSSHNSIAIGKWGDKPSRQPSKALKQKVRDGFDAEMLKHLCTTWDFSTYAERFDLDDGGFAAHERFYYYQDNGSDVLAVAHLDSVQDHVECQVVETAAGLLAVSGALDDRLGVYVILDLLPKLGITCDWLLTTDEEMAASTAEDFATEKGYNWMFQFDRGGTDVVMYQYETQDLCDLVEDCGARVGQGSFSDICMLGHLGCAGFNWGVGYADYHSERSHAWLEDTFRMVARFVKFYQANHDTKLEHVPQERWWKSSSSVVWDDENLVVVDCGHEVDLDDLTSYVELEKDYILCTECGTVPNNYVDDEFPPLEDVLSEMFSEHRWEAAG